MTVGSRNTRVTTTGIWTHCSSNSSFTSGDIVSWNGADSAPTPRVSHPASKRRVERLPKAKRNYIGRVLNLDRLTEEPLSGNIFQRTLTHREMAPGAGPIGSAVGLNAYTKSWTLLKEKVFRWDAPGYPNRIGTVSNCGFGNNWPETALFPGSALTSEDEYALIRRLRNQIMGSDFNLANSLGAEGLDTLRFLGDVSGRVYRAQAQVRKLNLRGAFDVLRQYGRAPHPRSTDAKFLKLQEDRYRQIRDDLLAKDRKDPLAAVPPQAWLEYQLAIAPLLGDVDSAAKQLGFILHKKQRTRYVATLQKRVASVLPTWGSSTYWPGYKVTRKQVIAYFTHEPRPMDFSGWQNPETVIWEAIPFSFIVDRFVDIGGYLEARATVGSFPPGLFVTSTKVETVMRDPSARYANGVVNNTLDGSGMHYVVGSFTRTISSSLNVPKPRVRPLGGFDSWKKVTDTVALIASMAFGKLRSSSYRE